MPVHGPILRGLQSELCAIYVMQEHGRPLWLPQLRLNVAHAMLARGLVPLERLLSVHARRAMQVHGRPQLALR